MVPVGILDDLGEISRDIERGFNEERRVLSFEEYLDLFASDPVRYTRDAARYVRDMFDHYGRTDVERPAGTHTRFRLFDLPWRQDGERRRDALVGQESVQGELYRVLSNFVREGRPNRLILLHGPNGSAKSTVAAAVMSALEHYSSLDDGPLYRFHWVFPTEGLLKGAIGFADKRGARAKDKSYAHLPDDQIDSRVHMEVRDHPLFLLPAPQRQVVLERAYERAGVEGEPPEWLLRGRVSHKGRQVLDTLMMSYDGDLSEVLRHVQIERYFISRRYRVGAVTLGPQLSIDAGERQVTSDRSLAALPTSLQAVTLFEAFGELVDATGGVLEFSDLLKRPIDAFKYLQITAETGEVALRSQNLQLNCVLLGSGNENHLAAFREHPEFASFRGRLELVRCPYLRSWTDELAIYDAQIAPQARTHVAPHATELAAMFATLTRMRRPDPDAYEKPLSAIVSELTAFEKMDLYGSGTTPARLDDESAKLLSANVPVIFRESDPYPIYEGSIGASPRAMRTVLLDAAQSEHYDCLSPFAVLDELDKLCERTSEYEWLQQERLPGGYHDHVQFRELLKARLLDMLEDEVRVASGLVEETRYSDLFDRYITHVSYWVKGEKVRNEVTGAHEEPDARLMEEVEALLGSTDKAEPLRHSLINRVAAWAIDNPDEPMDNERVFKPQLAKLRDAVFSERRVAVAKLCRDAVLVLSGDTGGFDDARRSAADGLVGEMKSRFGYEDSSVKDAGAALLRERYAELLT